jgi:two-component system, response regulator PdtaR
MSRDQELCVLIVEDEALVALELEQMLEDDGFRICGVADCTSLALEHMKAHQPDVALVDLHLADGFTGVEIAADISNNGCMVVFMTANVNRVPYGLPGTLGVIPKPYTESGFRSAMRYVRDLCEGRTGNPPASLIDVTGR